MADLSDALTIIEAELAAAADERKELEETIDRLSDKMDTTGYSKAIERLDYRVQRLVEATAAIRKLLPPPKRGPER